MAIEVGQDFSVGDRAGDGSAVFIDHDGRNAHHVAAGAGGVGGLDGVTGGAGDALVLEGALLGHALGQVAGEQGHGIVAAFAVARELHPFLVDEHVDVFQIPGGTEAVGVRGLAPLVVGLLVAVAAVLRRVKALGAEELAVDRHGVGGQERRVLAEGVVVAGGDGVVEWRGRAR